MGLGIKPAIGATKINSNQNLLKNRVIVLNTLFGSNNNDNNNSIFYRKILREKIIKQVGEKKYSYLMIIIIQNTNILSSSQNFNQKDINFIYCRK